MATNDTHGNTTLHAQRREEILVAARECFDAHGYAETTMESVAEKAGLSKGSIYNYFQSKHDLFQHLFMEAFSDENAGFERLMAGAKSAREALTQMLDEWFHRLEHYSRIGRLFMEFWAVAAREHGQFAEWFSETYHRWSRRLGQVIAEGARNGEFRQDFDPQTAAAIIIAVLDGITLQNIVIDSMNVDAEFRDSLKRGILTGLTAAPRETPE
jgi:AcrR family transcriptional regulator